MATIAEVYKLREQIRSELDGQVGREAPGLTRAQAEEKKPSLKLDTGIIPTEIGSCLSDSDEASALLSLTIYTKGGIAPKIAKRLLIDHPDKVRLFRPVTEAAPAARKSDREYGAALRANIRPLEIGSMISHIKGLNGSLGCFVETDDGVCLLSASHVIALGGDVIQFPIQENKEKIVQPGCGGSKDGPAPTDVVAVLTRNFNILRDGHEESSDAAVASLLGDLGSTVVNEIPRIFAHPYGGQKINGITDIRNLVAGDRIIKVGSSTGLTIGEFAKINDRVSNVDVPQVGKVNFTDLVSVRWLQKDRDFAQGGDSGALYIVEKDFTALALHITTGPPLREYLVQEVGGKLTVVESSENIVYSYGCPLINFKDRFNFELL